MRDHKYHTSPMMAGMWGAKPSLDFEFSQFLLLRLVNFSAWAKQDDKYADQVLLSKVIFPEIQGKVLAHDSYHCGLWPGQTRPFPSQRPEEPLNFVGAVQDEKATPVLMVCPPPCRKKPDWIYC